MVEDFPPNDFLNSSGKRKISTAIKGNFEQKRNIITAATNNQQNDVQLKS